MRDAPSTYVVEHVAGKPKRLERVGLDVPVHMQVRVLLVIVVLV